MSNLQTFIGAVDRFDALRKKVYSEIDKSFPSILEELMRKYQVTELEFSTDDDGQGEEDDYYVDVRLGGKDEDDNDKFNDILEELRKFEKPIVDHLSYLNGRYNYVSISAVIRNGKFSFKSEDHKFGHVKSSIANYESMCSSYNTELENLKKVIRSNIDTIIEDFCKENKIEGEYEVSIDVEDHESMDGYSIEDGSEEDGSKLESFIVEKLGFLLHNAFVAVSFNIVAKNGKVKCTHD